MLIYVTMNTNVEVTKNGKENTTNLIRRFTRRVQGAGIRRVRSLRYRNRILSEYTKKKKTLKKIKRISEVEKLKKLGRM